MLRKNETKTKSSNRAISHDIPISVATDLLQRPIFLKVFQKIFIKKYINCKDFL